MTKRKKIPNEGDIIFSSNSWESIEPQYEENPSSRYYGQMKFRQLSGNRTFESGTLTLNVTWNITLKNSWEDHSDNPSSRDFGQIINWSAGDIAFT